MLKKLKNDKKGFTLVELIVVLVILAILAALLVPALTGYIDKAKEKAVIADTRSVVMAAQTLADEAYAGKNIGETTNITFGDSNVDVTLAEVKKLSEVQGEINSITAAGGTVSEVKYTYKGKQCTYTAPKSTKNNDGTTTTTEGKYEVAK